ncbi:MAG: hypothetical protein IKI54_04705 [Lachnospiraceae bacterium]|nr:hypothetical protein [Lachnospiraceae bacterium]
MRKQLKGHLLDMILIFVIFGLMAFANMNAYDAASSHFNEAAASQYSYSTQKTEK